MPGKHPRTRARRLPEVYEAYLVYCQRTRHASDKKVQQIRRVLRPFERFLRQSHIKLAHLRIEYIDAFLAEFYVGFAPGTCRLYRSYLRGFLTYLYHERGILRKDLAPLVVGAPMFAKAQPPKFLRSWEVKQLLASLDLSSPTKIRTRAMVHLAYFLGLRPQEICKIRMKDISFSQAELSVKIRKNKSPLMLPLADILLKSIAAYVIGVRPKSKHEYLFLNLFKPYRPLSLSYVSRCISDCIKAVNPFASPYWLRHTYAQNLLEAGASIFEIKEMLGHDSIEATRKYLQVHIELMRKVILDEEI
jgi:site-specific recombinase XerD